MKVNKEYTEYIYNFEDQKDKPVGNESRNDLDKDAFLRLLTTQLSNQDPLNPIEDREFIAQLAQFSSLEQMVSLNKTLDSKSDEMVESLEYMNLNQVQANVQILQELARMRKAMEAYFGNESDEDTEVDEDDEDDNPIDND